MRGPRTAMKSGPHLPQLEKALAQKRRPNTAINKKKKKKKDQIIKGLAGYVKGFAFYSENREQALIGLTGTGNHICILGPCL